MGKETTRVRRTFTPQFKPPTVSVAASPRGTCQFERTSITRLFGLSAAVYAQDRPRPRIFQFDPVAPREATLLARKDPPALKLGHFSESRRRARQLKPDPLYGNQARVQVELVGRPPR